VGGYTNEFGVWGREEWRMWRRRVEWLQLGWMYGGCGREGRGIGRRRRTVATGEDVVSDSDISDSPALPTTTTTAIATTWLTGRGTTHPHPHPQTSVFCTCVILLLLRSVARLRVSSFRHIINMFPPVSLSLLQFCQSVKRLSADVIYCAHPQAKMA